MRKRKERLDAWRAKKKKEEEEEEQAKQVTNGNDEEEEGSEEKKDGGEEKEKKKGWTLEDDDEDDEEGVVPMDDEAADAQGGEKAGKPAAADGAGSVQEMDEDVDPLDAFMVGVQEEVKQINTAFQKKVGTQIVGTGKETMVCLLTLITLYQNTC